MRAWKLIFQLARFRPGLLFVRAVVLGLFAYFLPLLSGLVIRQFFDTVAGQGSPDFGIPVLVALLAGISIAQFAIAVSASFVEVTLHASAQALVRKNLLERILELPGARAMRSSAGEAISRFRNDVEIVVSALHWAIDPVGQLLAAGVALAILARIDLRITVVVVVPTLIVIGMVNLAGRRIRRLRLATQESIGGVTGFLGEVFGAVQAVKVASAEKRVTRHFRELNDARKKATLRDVLLGRILYSGSLGMSSIATGAILLLAGASIRSGDLTLGDFALFVSYLTWLSMMIATFGHILTLYRQTGVSIERLVDLLQGADPERLVKHGPIHLREKLPEVVRPERSAEDRLERFEAVGVTYFRPENQRGIKDIDLRLDRGTFTVITGQIGSGKTTLVRVLLGLLPMDSGALRWNDRPIEHPAEFMVPPRCAYVPQVPRLFSGTLRQNILLGMPGDDEEVLAAIRAAVLEADISQLEHGLDTLVGPRGFKLSGGQVQRAAAARMFVREAELLVFDDLSSALDVETESRLWERLKDLESSTCLVVSHRRAALRRADQILVLEDGEVVGRGPLNQLLQASPAMRRLWEEGIQPPSSDGSRLDLADPASAPDES